MVGVILMMPTSGQANAVPVAAPLEYAPKLPLMAGFCPVAGNTSEGVSVTEAGEVSRPKLGVATPDALLAVTVEVNDCPAAMNTVPPGTVGKLAVRAPTGCRYLDDAMRQHTYVRDGWNLTGDAFTQDEAGLFWYHARTDDMIVSSGYNISGAEVEEVLLDHPAVAECAVVGEALRR